MSSRLRSRRLRDQRSNDRKSFDALVEKQIRERDDNATEVDTIDATLDAWAEQRAIEKNITMAAATVEILDEPSGRALYADRCAAMNDPKVVAKQSRAAMRRAAEVRKVSTNITKAEAAIDEFTKSIQRPGESDAAAMTRALEQRPNLYRDYLVAQMMAAE